MIGVLKSEIELWPEFVQVVEDRPYCIVDDLDLEVFPNLLQIPRVIGRLVRHRDVPKRHQIIASRLLQVGSRVLLTTDRPVSLLNSMAVLCPQIKQVMVAHTIIQPLNRPRVSETHAFPCRLLFVWGQRDLEAARSLQPELQIRVIGSLRNSAYLHHRFASEISKPAKRVCLISSYLGEAKEESRKNSPSDIRFKLRQRLLEVARAASEDLQLPIHVALKPPTMSPFKEGNELKYEAERSYFRHALRGLPHTFSDPSHRFSTYAATSDSILTIGLPTGAILETLGRGHAALAVDTDGSDEFVRFPKKYRTGGLNQRISLNSVNNLVERELDDPANDLTRWIFDGRSDGALVRLRAMLDQFS